MTEKEFKKLIEKTLQVLEGYAIDKNGNKKMHIVGIEKLYKQLTLKGVSYQRELLIAYEMEKNNRTRTRAEGLADTYLKCEYLSY